MIRFSFFRCPQRVDHADAVSLPKGPGVFFAQRASQRITRSSKKTPDPFTRLTRVFMTGWLALGILLTIFSSRSFAQEPVNYEQQVKPILRESCFACHNQEKSKGGLALDSFGALMTGGASGEVVYGGDLESSRLWQLINHEDEPKMPPGAPKLADNKLAVIRSWIESGAIERVGGKPKKTNDGFAFQAPVDQTGPGAMPQGTLRQPVVHSERAGAVAALACSPNAPLVAISGQQQVSLYHTDEERLMAVLPFPAAQVNALSFSRDGRLLVAGGGRAGSQGMVALYDVATGDRVSQIGDELDAVLAADISPSLQRVALGGPSKIVRLFDTGSGQLMQQMKRHTDWIMAVAFSPDGQYLISADRQGGLWMWEAETGLEVQDFAGHKQAITGLAWRPDAKIFASCSEDGNVRFWDVNTGKQIRTWAAHPGGALAVRFTSDGGALTSGRNGLAKQWDGAAKELRGFPKLTDAALQVAMSHDNARVFAADWNGQVRCWSAADGTELWQPLANPPTLEMRLEAARKQLEAKRAAAARDQQALAKVTGELQSLQTEHEAASEKLNAGWKRAIRQLQESSDGETETAPNLEALEQEVQQLATRLAQVMKNAQTATATVAAANGLVVIAEQRIQQAENELKQFRHYQQQLQGELASFQRLAQKTEEEFEAVERERLAILELIASAAKVSSTTAEPAVAAMEEADPVNPIDDGDNKSARPADWASSVENRAKQELAHCDERLAAAAQQRTSAAQQLVRARQRLDDHMSAFGHDQATQ